MRSVGEHAKQSISINKAVEKWNAVLVCRILFFSSFFVAVFLANTLWKNEAAWVGYMHHNMLDDMTMTAGENQNHLLTVLAQRLPIWIGLILFGRCIWGIAASYINAAWQGLLMGLAIAVLIMRYGLWGIVFFFLMSFPHLIAYFISYVLLYHNNFSVWKEKRVGPQTGENIPQKRGFLRKEIAVYSMVVMTFLAGVLLESYVNVIFLSKMVDVMIFF